MWEAGRSIQVIPDKNARPYLKNAWPQGVESLPNKHKALSSYSSITKKKRKM
jgi:hypothetical protein